jgi:enamine deaminase RidA (YjgF/YER057c/UK114 family)
MRSLWVAFIALAALVVQAQMTTAAQPGGIKDRVSTPAVDAGDYVYVSGQGPRRTDGSIPSTFSEQVRQALDNVNSTL